MALALAGDCCSDSTASLGTSMCCGCGLKKQKEKKKKRGKQSETSLHPLVSWVVWRGGQGPSLQRRYCTAHSSRHTLSEPSHIMQPGVGGGWGEKDEISICHSRTSLPINPDRKRGRPFQYRGDGYLINTPLSLHKCPMLTDGCIPWRSLLMCAYWEFPRRAGQDGGWQ